MGGHFFTGGRLEERSRGGEKSGHHVPGVQFISDSAANTSKPPSPSFCRDSCCRVCLLWLKSSSSFPLCCLALHGVGTQTRKPSLVLSPRRLAPVCCVPHPAFLPIRTLLQSPPPPPPLPKASSYFLRFGSYITWTQVNFRYCPCFSSPPFMLLLLLE